jgi:hypothetical protein
LNGTQVNHIMTDAVTNAASVVANARVCLSSANKVNTRDCCVPVWLIRSAGNAAWDAGKRRRRCNGGGRASVVVLRNVLAKGERLREREGERTQEKAMQLAKPPSCHN